MKLRLPLPPLMFFWRLTIISVPFLTVYKIKQAQSSNNTEEDWSLYTNHSRSFYIIYLPIHHSSHSSSSPVSILPFLENTASSVPRLLGRGASPSTPLNYIRTINNIEYSNQTANKFSNQALWFFSTPLSSFIILYFLSLNTHFKFISNHIFQIYFILYFLAQSISNTLHSSFSPQFKIPAHPN